jgi:hypothetical protein
VPRLGHRNLMVGHFDDHITDGAGDDFADARSLRAEAPINWDATASTHGFLTGATA